MTRANGGRQPIPAIEWIVAAIGALLVAGTIGYLVLHAVVRDQAPPDLRVVAEGTLALQGGYLVEFRAINAGAQAAAAVLIEGALEGPGGTIETSEATIDYLPARSERQGGLIFSHDPRAYRLRLRPKGWVDP